MAGTPDLLAPAGNFDSLKAAIENGADAVYLGGKYFSARSYAGNFSVEEIEKAIDYAHLRGVKVYVTVNTLIKNKELREAANFLKAIYEMGADAAIVQDIGLISLAKQIPIELHASTQMTIHNVEGARLLEQLGFKRVILARELSLEEIKQIKKEVNIELECFVHGALCFSYSGQCLMSSMIGGRSGNRGRCAQPCRKRYALISSSGKILSRNYLMSTRDLNTLEHIPDLIKAGIAGFKIEGRMKRPEYVAIVTGAYRSAIDRYFAGEEVMATEEEKRQVEQIFNRRFTSGYFYRKPGRKLISYDAPDNRGIEIGEILSYENGEARVKLKEDLSRGDGIAVEGSGKSISWIAVEGRQVQSAKSGDIAAIKLDRAAKKGSRVYKTLDACLIKKARSTYEGRFRRKVVVEVKASAKINKPFTLQLKDEDGNIVVETSDLIVATAVEHALTDAALVQQLDRLGATVFTTGDISVDLDEGVFVPFSVIAEVRRRAIEALEKKRVNRARRKAPDLTVDSHLTLKPSRSRDIKPALAVNAGSLRALKSAVAGGADLAYLDYRALSTEAIELCRESNVKLIAHTGRIAKSSEIEKIREAMPEIEKTDGVMTGNLGTLKYFGEHTSLPLYIDFSINVFNSLAADLLSTLFPQIVSIALSPELTFPEIEAVALHSSYAFECIVHGTLPLLISEHCIAGSGIAGEGKCSAPCRSDSYSLIDEAGYVFPLCFDSSCRTGVLNSRELCVIEHLPAIVQSGITNLRVEAINLKHDRVEPIVSIYRRNLDAYLGDKEAYKFDIRDKKALEKMASKESFTKGHFFRGVE